MTRWESTQAAVLGDVLLDPNLAGKLVSQTGPEDFDGPGRICYMALRSLFLQGGALDPITVQGALGEKYSQYLRECLEITPTAANFSAHVDQLRSLSRQARIRHIANQILLSEDLEEMQGLIRQASEDMITTSRITSWDMARGFQELYERKTKGETYLPTGLSRLDSEIFLSPGDYVVLAGRPSRGKSALALQMALQQSRERSVGFYSLETSLPKLMDRIASTSTGVRMDSIKRARLDPGEWAELSRVSARLADPQQCRLQIHHAPGCTVEEIMTNAWNNRHEVIYIDYMQLLRDTGKGERYDAVTRISMAIHEYAQRFGIVVVALSQLNRASTTAKSEEPGMADLRESGQIEQDADAILMLYCERKDDLAGNRELKIAKNKEGTTGYVKLRWDGDCQRMTAISQRTPPPLPKLRELPKTTPVPPQWEAEQTSIEEVADNGN